MLRQKRFDMHFFILLDVQSNLIKVRVEQFNNDANILFQSSFNEFYRVGLFARTTRLFAFAADPTPN